MAIQPSVRAAGSSHHLFFRGDLALQLNAGAQTVNGEVVQGIVANTRIFVIFALADMTDLTDQSTRLPANVFDDTQPAAASPHVNTGFGGPTIPPVPVIGVPTGKTWMQNVRIRVQENLASTATPRIAQVDVLNPVCQIDGGAGEGLAQGTGTPCVAIGFYFTGPGVAALEAPGGVVPVIIEIEIPHTRKI